MTVLREDSKGRLVCYDFLKLLGLPEVLTITLAMRFQRVVLGDGISFDFSDFVIACNCYAGEPIMIVDAKLNETIATTCYFYFGRRLDYDPLAAVTSTKQGASERN